MHTEEATQEEVVEEGGREVSLSRLEEEIQVSEAAPHVVRLLVTCVFLQEEGGESEEEEEGAVFLDLSTLRQTAQHQVSPTHRPSLPNLTPFSTTVPY